MNFALRRYCSVLGLSLITCLVACGDDGVTCPDGMILIGGLCEVVADAAPRDGGENDASVDGFMPDSGPPCEPMGDMDLPDAEFTDANCDGYDGDLELAVALVPAGATAPMGVAATAETLTNAFVLAASQGLTQVWLPTSTFDETLELAAGVSVYGGYDPDNWQRTRAGATRFRGPGPLLIATDISTPTTVALVGFEADDAARGESSIAARLTGSDGVTLEEVVLDAGRGGDGVDTTQPPAAADGDDGDEGSMTGISVPCAVATSIAAPMGGAGGGSTCGCHAGGRGGNSGGGNGERGIGIMEGSGGCDDGPVRNGGSGGTPPEDGQIGRVGPSAGEPGDGAAAGEFTMSGWVPGDGTAGGGGRSGQGGGGGGAAEDVAQNGNDFCIYYGASGGGGGAGGCGGEGSLGGTGGGASVALFLWDSTITLIDVELIAAAGGDGGNAGTGGDGGEGGRGGLGGPRGEGPNYFEPLASLLPGGDGGPGGDGAPGGGGGGGAGGPSVGIVLGGDAGESAESSDVNITVGAAGAAGLGGDADNDGAVGVAMERLDPEG